MWRCSFIEIHVFPDRSLSFVILFVDGERDRRFTKAVRVSLLIPFERRVEIIFETPRAALYPDGNPFWILLDYLINKFPILFIYLFIVNYITN